MPTSPRAKDILMTQSDWKSVHTETKANFRCSVIAYKVSGKTRVSPPDNMNRVDASWKCFPVSQTVFTKYVRKQWKSFTNLICYIIWCILTELKRWWIFWLLRVERSQKKIKISHQYSSCILQFNKMPLIFPLQWQAVLVKLFLGFLSTCSSLIPGRKI